MQEERSYRLRARELLERSGLGGKPLTTLIVLGVIVAAIIGISIALSDPFRCEEAVSLSQDRTEASPTSDDSVVTEATVFVDVEGAVNAPGVYELAEGSRVVDALNAAQGVNAEADSSTVNLARVLVDGEQIYIPTQSEDVSARQITQQGAQGNLVNINTATPEELCTLDGIGEVTASKIVADRDENGPFVSTDDLMRVSGIGEKKFAQIEDDICV